jgi:hypothetical protein
MPGHGGFRKEKNAARVGCWFSGYTAADASIPSVSPRNARTRTPLQTGTFSEPRSQRCITGGVAAAAGSPRFGVLLAVLGGAGATPPAVHLGESASPVSALLTPQFERGQGLFAAAATAKPSLR